MEIVQDGHGLALWVPEPNQSLSPEYHENGIRIGDVGTLRVDGSGGDGGESEWSAVDEEDSYRDPRPRSRTRGRSFIVADTTRPSLVSRSHPSQPSPTKHPSNSHSSSGSPPLDDLSMNVLPQSSSTSPKAPSSHSDEHHHPDELTHAFHNHGHRYDDDDYSYDYDYDSSEECSCTYSDDGGELPDVEISSSHYDPDVFIEGPAVNPQLIPSIHGSSGSRSTSIRRNGSSATESYWSGQSGYGSFTDRNGSIISIWSYAGSGAEGRQEAYHSSEELGLAFGDNAGGGTHLSSDEDWRRLLGPVQMANASPSGQPNPVLPDSPRSPVPSELDGSVHKRSLPGTYQNPWGLMHKTPFSKSHLEAAGKGKGRERPPSMMSTVSVNSLASSLNFPHDDAFARGLNAWGGQSYRDLRKEWVFRKDRSGRSGSSSTSAAVAGSSATSSRSERTTRQARPGMSVPSQENWSNYLLGSFVVIRKEVGRETSGSGHVEIPSSSVSKSGLRPPGSVNASLSSAKSPEDKRRDESVVEGITETRLTRAIGEPTSRLKSPKLKPSSQSQTSTLTPKSPEITEFAHMNTKPPQQRLVIRKINGNVRERVSRQKTEARAPSMTEGSAYSPPISNESTSRSPAIVSPSELSFPEHEPSIPVGASTSSQHSPSSSRDDSHFETPEQPRAPLSPSTLSPPPSYDPLHPAVVVHKHSKVAAFSFSRQHRTSWAHGGTGYSSHASTKGRSKINIMLAQRNVHRAFTTTETTKRFMETALLMNFDSGVRGKREKEKEQATSGIGSGEKDKRKDKEKGKEKRKDKEGEREKATRGVPLPSAAADVGNEINPRRHLQSKQSRADNYDKAYETLDRPNVGAIPSITRTRRTSNSSLLKRLTPWTDTLKGSSASEVTSSSSSNTLVGSTASFGGMTSAAYLPPWMAFPTRDTQEMHRKTEDAMGTLKTSFENVGLLPSVREAGDREKDKAKGREKKERSSLRRLGGKEREKDRENDILNCVPPESLFMLLPLWPGETDPYAHHYFPFDMPPVPLEERMFLLVYYKPLSQEMLAAMDIDPKMTFSPIRGKHDILLPYFHIIARQVSYAELRSSRMCLPDQGLAVSGPLEEAFNTAPRLQIRPPSSPSFSSQFPPSLGTPVRECLMGSCYSRESGIEFDPVALLELGLCSVLEEEDVIPNPLPPGRFEEEFERSITLKLTAVGSAVVEMAWAGGLALTSFSPVDELTQTKR